MLAALMDTVQSSLRAARAAFLFAALLLGPFSGATPASPTHGQKSEPAAVLPKTTGEPLTVKPVDRPDLACTIMAWDTSGRMPTLKLLCPPDDTFAPLRVYLKLSWQDEKDLPDDYHNIMARPKTRTLLRTTKDAALVRLEVANAEGQARIRWISFTGVVDVALLSD